MFHCCPSPPRNEVCARRQLRGARCSNSVTEPQLSLAAGLVNVTPLAKHEPASATTVTSAGQSDRGRLNVTHNHLLLAGGGVPRAVSGCPGHKVRAHRQLSRYVARHGLPQCKGR